MSEGVDTVVRGSLNTLQKMRFGTNLTQIGMIGGRLWRDLASAGIVVRISGGLNVGAELEIARAFGGAAGLQLTSAEFKAGAFPTQRIAAASWWS